MTGSYWVAICDRCGYKELTVEKSALRLPTSWGVISFDLRGSIDLCPRCKGEYEKILQDFMERRADETNSRLLDDM